MTSPVLLHLGRVYGIEHPNILTVSDRILERRSIVRNNSTLNGVAQVIAFLISSRECRQSVQKRGTLSDPYEEIILEFLGKLPSAPILGEEFLSTVVEELQSALN